MLEQKQGYSLPEKSTLWIGANIGAGILVITVIIRFIGGIIFAGFVAENKILNVALGIILLLIGIWLGTMFGIRYVVKRSQINLEKINNISIVAATIPFIFFLLWMIIDLYIAFAGKEKFVLDINWLIGTILSAIVAFFFVRHSLRKFVKLHI